VDALGPVLAATVSSQIANPAADLPEVTHSDDEIEYAELPVKQTHLDEIQDFEESDFIRTPDQDTVIYLPDVDLHRYGLIINM
jgi:hypothetical protein